MKNPRFLIVSTGYNCEKFVQPCIDSIKKQTYINYNVFLVNDGSIDKTYFELYHNCLSSYLCFGNKNNYGTFYARDMAINKFNNDFDIIVLLDMDDQLLPNTLEVVAKEYEQKDCWMTYGNYIYSGGGKCPIDIKYSDEVHAARDYRHDKFRCTHLRTFRKELYHLIPKWDLTQSEINSYPDVEILFSMMEMCGKGKISCIEQPIYIYNNSNPLSTLNRFGKDHAGYNAICNRPKRELIKQLSTNI